MRDIPVLQLCSIGIVRFDEGRLNSYYILCLTEDAKWGFAKFNKDKDFDSIYVQDNDEWESRYDKEGNLKCRYRIKRLADKLHYEKDNGESYIIDPSFPYFEKRGTDTKYYYVR